VPCKLSFDNQVESLANSITPHIYYIVREALFNATKLSFKEITMAHKRTFVRVPIMGKAVLSTKHGDHISTKTRDISPGGIGIDMPSTPLEQATYQIEITTESGEEIQLTATLIYKSSHSAGFKTSEIDRKNLQIVYDLVADFQSTDGFIEQIDAHDLLEQKFIDENGHEISVSFDVNPNK